MKPENIAFLEEKRHHYETFVRAGFIQQFDGATKNGLLRVIHEEFNAGYPDPTYCQTCVADMLKFAYVQYDKWIAAQPKEVEVIPAAPEPIASTAELDGAVLKTTFPLHERPKKKRRGKKQ